MLKDYSETESETGSENRDMVVKTGQEVNVEFYELRLCLRQILIEVIDEDELKRKLDKFYFDLRESEIIGMLNQNEGYDNQKLLMLSLCSGLLDVFPLLAKCLPDDFIAQNGQDDASELLRAHDMFIEERRNSFLPEWYNLFLGRDVSLGDENCDIELHKTGLGKVIEKMRKLNDEGGDLFDFQPHDRDRKEIDSVSQQYLVGSDVGEQEEVSEEYGTLGEQHVVSDGALFVPASFVPKCFDQFVSELKKYNEKFFHLSSGLKNISCDDELVNDRIKAMESKIRDFDEDVVDRKKKIDVEITEEFSETVRSKQTLDLVGGVSDPKEQEFVDALAVDRMDIEDKRLKDLEEFINNKSRELAEKKLNSRKLKEMRFDVDREFLELLNKNCLNYRFNDAFLKSGVRIEINDKQQRVELEFIKAELLQEIGKIKDANTGKKELLEALEAIEAKIKDSSTGKKELLEVLEIVEEGGNLGIQSEIKTLRGLCLSHNTLIQERVNARKLAIKLEVFKGRFYEEIDEMDNHSPERRKELLMLQELIEDENVEVENKIKELKKVLYSCLYDNVNCISSKNLSIDIHIRRLEAGFKVLDMAAKKKVAEEGLELYKNDPIVMDKFGWIWIKDQDDLKNKIGFLKSLCNGGNLQYEVLEDDVPVGKLKDDFKALNEEALKKMAEEGLLKLYKKELQLYKSKLNKYRLKKIKLYQKKLSECESKLGGSGLASELDKLNIAENEKKKELENKIEEYKNEIKAIKNDEPNRVKSEKEKKLENDIGILESFLGYFEWNEIKNKEDKEKLRNAVDFLKYFLKYDDSQVYKAPLGSKLSKDIIEIEEGKRLSINENYYIEQLKFDNFLSDLEYRFDILKELSSYEDLIELKQSRHKRAYINFIQYITDDELFGQKERSVLAAKRLLGLDIDVGNSLTARTSDREKLRTFTDFLTQEYHIGEDFRAILYNGRNLSRSSSIEFSDDVFGDDEIFRLHCEVQASNIGVSQVSSINSERSLSGKGTIERDVDESGLVGDGKGVLLKDDTIFSLHRGDQVSGMRVSPIQSEESSSVEDRLVGDNIKYIFDKYDFGISGTDDFEHLSEDVVKFCKDNHNFKEEVEGFVCHELTTIQELLDIISNSKRTISGYDTVKKIRDIIVVLNRIQSLLTIVEESELLTADKLSNVKSILSGIGIKLDLSELLYKIYCARSCIVELRVQERKVSSKKERGVSDTLLKKEESNTSDVLLKLVDITSMIKKLNVLGLLKVNERLSCKDIGFLLSIARGCREFELILSGQKAEASSLIELVFECYRKAGSHFVKSATMGNSEELMKSVGVVDRDVLIEAIKTHLLMAVPNVDGNNAFYHLPTEAKESIIEKELGLRIEQVLKLLCILNPKADLDFMIEYLNDSSILELIKRYFCDCSGKMDGSDFIVMVKKLVDKKYINLSDNEILSEILKNNILQKPEAIMFSNDKKGDGIVLMHFNNTMMGGKLKEIEVKYSLLDDVGDFVNPLVEHIKKFNSNNSMKLEELKEFRKSIDVLVLCGYSDIRDKTGKLVCECVVGELFELFGLKAKESDLLDNNSVVKLYRIMCKIRSDILKTRYNENSNMVDDELLKILEEKIGILIAFIDSESLMKLRLEDDNSFYQLRKAEVDCGEVAFDVDYNNDNFYKTFLLPSDGLFKNELKTQLLNRPIGIESEFMSKFGINGRGTNDYLRLYEILGGPEVYYTQILPRVVCCRELFFAKEAISELSESVLGLHKQYKRDDMSSFSKIPIGELEKPSESAINRILQDFDRQFYSDAVRLKRVKSPGEQKVMNKLLYGVDIDHIYSGMKLKTNYGIRLNFRILGLSCLRFFCGKDNKLFQDKCTKLFDDICTKNKGGFVGRQGLVTGEEFGDMQSSFLEEIESHKKRDAGDGLLLSLSTVKSFSHSERGGIIF